MQQMVAAWLVLISERDRIRTTVQVVSGHYSQGVALSRELI